MQITYRVCNSELGRQGSGSATHHVQVENLSPVAGWMTQRYCCVVLPAFENGALPPGIHPTSWDDVRHRFGFTPHRRNLLVGAYRAIVDLREAGCGHVWLDGSFVTAKEHPQDFDLAWDTSGVKGALLHPVLLDTTPPRHAQHARYGGDVIPNVTETNSGMPFRDFFQLDAVTGQPRGIVELDLVGGL